MDGTHFLPKGGLALDLLEQQVLQPGIKGLPITEPLRQGAIGVQGWNVLRADTSFPVAVLKTSALRHNLDWMRRFCEQTGAVLAPHGKTTMSPQLFGAQLANGAWGMTLANATGAAGPPLRRAARVHGQPAGRAGRHPQHPAPAARRSGF
jgi:D-serine dehydratase